MGAFLMVMTQTLMLLTTPQRLKPRQQSFSHPSVTMKVLAQYNRLTFQHKSNAAVKPIYNNNTSGIFIIFDQISFLSREVKSFALELNEKVWCSEDTDGMFLDSHTVL